MGTNKRARKKENRKQRLDQLARQSQRRRQRKVGVRIAIVLTIIIGIAGIFSVSGSDESATTDTTVASSPTTASVAGETISGETPCPAKDGSANRVAQFEQAPPVCIEDGVTYTAIVSTNKGDFSIVLDQSAAPIAVNNFVVLARYKYFDSTNCHRAIVNFVVQCGDPTATGSGGPGYQFADELPAAGSYKLGSIAMANSGPNTNGSQFFIITGDDGVNLPPNYTLFGQVTEGLDSTVPALDAAGNPDPAT
ncbi:MAG: peptidylprolyl isomerase, partial [Ilumatobacteraceae bacterium]